MNVVAPRALASLAMGAFELGCTSGVPIAGGSSAEPITVCVEMDGGACASKPSPDSAAADAHADADDAGLL
jgi:hypothetical protein